MFLNAKRKNRMWACCFCYKIVDSIEKEQICHNPKLFCKLNLKYIKTTKRTNRDREKVYLGLFVFYKQL